MIPVSFTSASCWGAQRISKPHMLLQCPAFPAPPEGQILASSASSCYLQVKGEGLCFPTRTHLDQAWKQHEGKKQWQLWCIKTRQSGSDLGVKGAETSGRPQDLCPCNKKDALVVLTASACLHSRAFLTVDMNGGFDRWNQSKNQHLEANNGNLTGSCGIFLQPH